MPGSVVEYLAPINGGSKGMKDETERRFDLQRYMAETRRLYGMMDVRLGEHKYFASELSVADFAIIGWAWRDERHKVDVADSPHVQRSYQMMMARPGVARGFAVPLRGT